MFASIILAAGEGSRLGRCKAALPFGEKQTFLSRLINIYLDSGVNDIYVITGNWRNETVAAAGKFSSTVCFANNDAPELGMYSSVRKGVSLLGGDVKYFFVHPVDMPLVSKETIMKMKDTALNFNGNNSWLVPEYVNKQGHPVLLPSSLIPELLEWNGERGLGGFLSLRNEDKQIEYVNDEGTIFDVDDREDHIKFQKFQIGIRPFS